MAAASRRSICSPSDDLETLPVLAGAPLFADQLPSGLVWLMQHGVIRCWPAGAVVLREGDHSDGVALVIGGEACLVGGDDALVHRAPGATVGEMEAITGNRRSRTGGAGFHGLETLDLLVAAVEERLRRSRAFSLGLLRRLALRLHES